MVERERERREERERERGERERGERKISGNGEEREERAD